MEIEGLFGGGKWQLVELLSKGQLSPLQISESLGTSVANVSQQLKLFDLLGLLASERVPNREKGKPRTLYSLSHDYIYVISMFQNFAKKALVKASPIQAAMARVLCIPDPSLHYPLLKLFWTLEPQLEQIHSMYFDKVKATLYVVSAGQLKLAPAYSFKHGISKIELLVKLVQKAPEKLSSHQFIIYDANHILKEVEA
jgi:predicted transcriptional regulator